MYKTESITHQSTKKRFFLWRWWVKPDCFLLIVKQKQTKKILWLLDVCTRGRSLYWLVFTRPALFKWNRRPVGPDARRLTQTGSLTRKLKAAEGCGPVVGWKYILHAFHWAAHLDYRHFCVCTCVPKHAVRSVCKGLKMSELCFIVVGLLAHLYMWSRNPNSVVKTKKEKEENLYQNVIFGDDLKVVTFPVTCAFTHARAMSTVRTFLDLSQHWCGCYVQ